MDLKVGSYVLCKRDYIYNDNFYFYENKSYCIVKIVGDTDTIMPDFHHVHLIDEFGDDFWFSYGHPLPGGYETFFYGLKETRNIKLNKINEETM